jgi:hypothetical protein
MPWAFPKSWVIKSDEPLAIKNNCLRRNSPVQAEILANTGYHTEELFFKITGV